MVASLAGRNNGNNASSRKRFADWVFSQHPPPLFQDLRVLPFKLNFHETVLLVFVVLLSSHPQPRRSPPKYLRTMSSPSSPYVSSPHEELSQDSDSNVIYDETHSNFTFFFEKWHGPKIKVRGYIPEDHDENTLVVFVMHGVERNAGGYWREWHPHAVANKFVLITPQFSKKTFGGSDMYQLGNTLDHATNATLPEDLWTYTVVERIFEYMRIHFHIKPCSYAIYGHSAGAQFVHRFIMHLPQSRVTLAIAANAGWYTLPTFKTSFPYGLRKSAVTPEKLEESFSVPLVLLLGSSDTDENCKWLRKTERAEKQGSHRFARGHTFLKVGQAEALTRGRDCVWKIVVAEGVAHVNAEMAKHAVKLLVEHQSDPERIAELQRFCQTFNSLL